MTIRWQLLLRRADLFMEVARIDRALASCDVGSVSEFSTTREGHLPPGRSRRWLREHAPRIPGAVREGGKRGRGVIWRVSADAYLAWVEGQRRRVSNASCLAQHGVERWIDAAGYRTTRKRR